MKILRSIGCACISLWLGACATQAPPPSVPAPVPPHWHAPLPAEDDAARLPHDGALNGLSQWWRQQGDPLLVQLIEAAQAISPTAATASSRIEQARYARVAAGAALLPSVDASASISRSNPQPPIPLNTALQGGVQSSWELDLFGGNRANRDAAQARLEGAEAGWHDARVSIAAEVATRYYSLRACDKLAVVTRSDAGSRAHTARLTQLSTEAGFQSPANAALARASAAEAASRATQQRAQCDLDIKALVALSGLPEPELRQKIAEVPGVLPQSAAMAITALPAGTLTQRPDIFSAQREVAAASADVGSADAERYPRLSLNGSIAAATVRTGGVTANLETWSIGPLSLTLPLFDGGRRAANADAARARYEEAAALYRASVRQAVREVEEALVNLDSTAARSADAQLAVDGYRTSFFAVEARYEGGLASLFELEEARRSRLVAEITLISLQRDRTAAWIALYRAAGGGWSSPAPQ
ncbi:MAG: efflux transporter outer membrane subunit [Pseudomonadota bacterium]